MSERLPAHAVSSSAANAVVEPLPGRSEVQWTGLHLGSPTDGRLLVCMPASRPMWVRQDGRDAILRAADFALVDSARPFALRVDGDTDHVRVTLPSSPLTARLAMSCTAVRIDGSCGPGAVAASAIRSVAAQAPALDPAVRRAVAEPLAGLIALAAGATIDGPVRPSRSSLARAARAEVERSLSDPDLSRAIVARRLSISVRYLDRLLSAEGLSFGRSLLEARLRRCHSELVDPLADERPIGQIAADAGFQDASYFSRAFKRRYGMTPLQARRDHAGHEPVAVGC